MDEKTLFTLMVDLFREFLYRRYQDWFGYGFYVARRR
jgi:hypothetical protein